MVRPTDQKMPLPLKREFVTHSPQEVGGMPHHRGGHTGEAPDTVRRQRVREQP